MNPIARLWFIVVALCVTVAMIGNIVISGHVPGVPIWLHYIASLGLGAASWDAWVKAVKP